MRRWEANIKSGLKELLLCKEMIIIIYYENYA